MSYSSTLVALQVLSFLDAVAALVTVVAVLVEVERLAVSFLCHLVLEGSRADVTLKVSLH